MQPGALRGGAHPGSRPGQEVGMPQLGALRGWRGKESQAPGGGAQGSPGAHVAGGTGSLPEA